MQIKSKVILFKQIVRNSENFQEICKFLRKFKKNGEITKISETTTKNSGRNPMCLLIHSAYIGLSGTSSLGLVAVALLMFCLRYFNPNTSCEQESWLGKIEYI